jgi:hypothetical protein
MDGAATVSIARDAEASDDREDIASNDQAMNRSIHGSHLHFLKKP